MHRKTSLRGIAVAAAAGLIVAAPASAGAPSRAANAAAAPLTLRFLNTTTSFGVTSGDRAPRLGDRFWFREGVRQWRSGKAGASAGHADGTGEFLTRSLIRIAGTVHLANGTIEFTGTTSNAGSSQAYAIVGGTGRYATARGELTSRDVGGPDSGKTTVTLRLWSVPAP